LASGRQWAPAPSHSSNFPPKLRRSSIQSGAGARKTLTPCFMPPTSNSLPAPLKSPLYHATGFGRDRHFCIWMGIWLGFNLCQKKIKKKKKKKTIWRCSGMEFDRCDIVLGAFFFRPGARPSQISRELVLDSRLHTPGVLSRPFDLSKLQRLLKPLRSSSLPSPTNWIKPHPSALP